jgi:uncharacterized membrane protein YeaQ/YmgE (transglycosylase-associated protein family)
MTHYLVAMGLFGILRFAIFGLIIGALAKFFMPGKDPGGFWITMLLGMAGSVVATWILQSVGHYQEGQTAPLDRLVLRRDLTSVDLQDVQRKNGLGASASRSGASAGGSTMKALYQGTA